MITSLPFKKWFLPILLSISCKFTWIRWKVSNLFIIHFAFPYSSSVEYFFESQFSRKYFLGSIIFCVLIVHDYLLILSQTPSDRFLSNIFAWISVPHCIMPPVKIFVRLLHVCLQAQAKILKLNVEQRR